MHTTTDLADTINVLTRGWTERITHTTTRTTHTPGCTATALVWAPGYRTHHQCACPATVETHERPVRQNALLDQLAHHTAPRRRAGGGGRPAGKAGSRPPMSLEAQALTDRIRTTATQATTVLAAAAGHPVSTLTPQTSRALSGLVTLAAALSGDHPDLIDQITAALRAHIRTARILLDYDPHPYVLRDRWCHACGGRLAADDDALRTWCIGIGTVAGPPREHELGPVRYGPCGISYGRETWIADLVDRGRDWAA